MLPIYGYVADFVITIVAAGIVFAVWLSNRKRLAAETVGRAEEHAARQIGRAHV